MRKHAHVSESSRAYTEIVRCFADLITICSVAGGVASQFLLLAPSRAEESLVQSGDDGVALQLAIPRRVGCECHVSFVLQEGIVPAAGFMRISNTAR